MNIEDYKYLWDGSEPGWVLHHYEQINSYVLFQFDRDGPEKYVISKLRKLLPELKEMTLPEVYRLLRGKESFRTGEPLGNIEAKTLEEKLIGSGIRYQMITENVGNYTPVYKDMKALLIESEELSNLIAQKMIEAGVPVVITHVD